MSVVSNLAINITRKIVGARYKLGDLFSSKLDVDLMLTGNGNISMTYILPVTLYAFGNKKSPRSPRPSIDIAVDNDLVKPTQPPTGASTFADVRYAPLTGHYYKIEKGMLLPAGLAVIADGEDVGGTHSLTHHTIYPIFKMPFSEFVEKFMSCGWVYVGKKEVI